MTAIALRLVAADLLKVRKKLSTMIWSLVLAAGPVLIFLVVRAIQHSSNPIETRRPEASAATPTACGRWRSSSRRLRRS